MVAAAFDQHGLNGTHVDARTCIITDSALWQGRPAGSCDEAKLVELVLPLVEDGRTPVMGGFIGSTAEG